MSEETELSREEESPRERRHPAIKKVEALRGGRSLVVLMNFDRKSNPPVDGMSTQFRSDVKPPLFRVLKELAKNRGEQSKGIDLFLYTRGGDTNAVWPVVSLIREFDPDFEVLVPFRCHSAGTLVCLGARRIVLGPISELSPIDPTTANAFNPKEEGAPKSRLGISVEDVKEYSSFVQEQIGSESSIAPFLEALVDKVHPLALGNVQRALRQIEKLAETLLGLHGPAAPDSVKKLTSEFYSHLHMINRSEAREILGKEIVVHADDELAEAMDDLLGCYNKDFRLWESFHLTKFMADEPNKEATFAGGIVESLEWSYLHRTRVSIWQQSVIPSNVQIQIQAGQGMPLVGGLPRQYRPEPVSTGWERNLEPQGVTV